MDGYMRWDPRYHAERVYPPCRHAGKKDAFLPAMPSHWICCLPVTVAQGQAILAGDDVKVRVMDAEEGRHKEW